MIPIISESKIYEMLAAFMNAKYPDVPYHFDLSGVNNPSPASRAYYSRLNGRSWPDMNVAKASYSLIREKAYHGLYLEIKIDGTQLMRVSDQKKMSKGDYKIRKAGDWWDLHIEEQALMLERLRDQGYMAEFAVGFNECVRIITEYLG